MRIIAGTAGRKPIKVPHDVTRPTTDFVRQAIFSILGEWVVDADVADLYSGSGALGIEALSRGARSCVFVDESNKATKVIRENLTSTGLAPSKIVQADTFTFLKRDLSTYHLIFADPPYAKNPTATEWISKLLHSGLLQPRLTEDGLFYAEISRTTATPECGDWTLADRRNYGSSSILLYRKKSTTHGHAP